MNRHIMLLLVMLPAIGWAQEPFPVKKTPSGIVSLGMRSTVSLFDHSGSPGMGVGWQFRVQLHKRVNTEWFADYLTNNIENLGNRHDYHIGWSVMFYPLNEKPDKVPLFKPYILAGHCFDYTGITVNATKEFQHRWSAAVQACIGTHINITPRFDVSASGQYMMHLGKELHTHVEDGDLRIAEHKGGAMEGHLLFTLGLNYKIADLW